MKKRTTITVEMWEGTVIRRQTTPVPQCCCGRESTHDATCEFNFAAPTATLTNAAVAHQEKEDETDS
jgi:hypothetical protein